MQFRFVAASIAGAVVILGSAACGGGRTYPDRGDDAYNLASMSLNPSDLPAGFDEAQLPDHEFDNQAWAQVMGVDDPEAKVNQLDAQGRIKSYVSAFQAAQLGKVFAITSISTLYKDVKSAQESERQYACGVPIDDKTPLDPFNVPKIGDQSTGFLAQQDRGNGQSFSDTTFCFRTGRLVHVVQQTSLPGVEDLALNVRLAQRMLQHVNDTYDGKAAPAAATTPAGKGTAAPGTQGDGTKPPSGGSTSTSGQSTATSGQSTGVAGSTSIATTPVASPTK